MNHNNFILSPIDKILKDVVSASIGIGRGIETYPLCDYVMQSAFLKMTGAQEQKMKCICWELATNDYEYRYMRFTQSQLGECSNYKEKNIIYGDIINQIEKHGSTSFEVSSINKDNILSKTIISIDEIFSNSNLLIWAQKSFHEYLNIWSGVLCTYFANDKNNLFTANTSHPLRNIYEKYLYRHRNRIAHNTQSYQQNLPTLKTLVTNDYKYENYFIYFAMLILIDNIIIDIYKKYWQTIKEF